MGCAHRRRRPRGTPGSAVLADRDPRARAHGTGRGGPANCQDLEGASRRAHRWLSGRGWRRGRRAETQGFDKTEQTPVWPRVVRRQLQTLLAGHAGQRRGLRPGGGPAGPSPRRAHTDACLTQTRGRARERASPLKRNEERSPESPPRGPAVSPGRPGRQRSQEEHAQRAQSSAFGA